MKPKAILFPTKAKTYIYRVKYIFLSLRPKTCVKGETSHFIIEKLGLWLLITKLTLTFNLNEINSTDYPSGHRVVLSGS